MTAVTKAAAEIHIGADLLQPLIVFCRSLPTRIFTVVSDANTYAALGKHIHAALTQADLTVINVILTGDEVIADEHYLGQLLIKSPPDRQVFIGVGAGTISDITRYISFRTGNPFISVPTAASVDGFLSAGAPLIVDGIKETYKAHGPVGVFADLPTLMAAPKNLAAAGFGDIIGKLTSLADWKLGHVVWDEPYDEAIDQRVRKAIDSCVQSIDQLADHTEAGIQALMDALLESGLCMLEFGDSRPASGAEHHCSHYWELALLRTNRRALLHGAKVGYATTLIAQLYEKVRGWTLDEVRDRLNQSQMADYETEVQKIRQIYGSGADAVIHTQKRFLEMTGDQFAAVKMRIIDHWPQIQAIAHSVPPSSAISDILNRAGAPTSWQAVGLTAQDVIPALRYGHYLRSRFTIIKLMLACGIDVGTLFDSSI